MIHTKRFYGIFVLLLVSGYSWLLWAYSGNHTGATLCLFKNTTGLPCPSCGTTRALTLLLQGNVIGALEMNPLAVPAFLFLSITPFWLFADAILKKHSFFQFYTHTETIFQNRRVAIIALCVVGFIWSWNIWKGL
ncbi:MAG: DUF2752 domain-containing protein [Lacibacter sp.]|jgi:hypothetical protein